MLQVVHVKSENQKLHRCHVCGKIDVWSQDWMCRLVAIGTGYKGYEIDFNWEKIAAGKIYSSIKEKIWISEELENNIYGIYDYIKNIRYDLEEKALFTYENSRIMDIHVTEQWAKEAKEIIDTKKIDSNEKAVVLVNKFYNEFYLKRNNDFNNETKQMTIDESKNYWIKQNID